MKLLIDNGTLFADGVFLCYARSANARRYPNDGCYPVEILTDARGQYVNVAGIGRVGADGSECHVVLATVRCQHGAIPCAALVGKLLAIVENSKQPVVMEINNG